MVLIKACLDITMLPDEQSLLSDAELFNRAFYGYSMVGIIIQSVKSNFKYSPKELADIYAENQ